MKDFLTDEEMAALDNPQAAAQPEQVGDFMTDEQMDAMHPAEPNSEGSTQDAGTVISDARMDQLSAPQSAPSGDAVEQYRSRFQSMINDPKATTQQIVAFMHQNGINDVPAETMAQLRNRENSIKNYGTYAGQAVVDQGMVSPQQNVSGLEALGQGVGQGLSFGLLDEIGAGVGAAANSVADALGGGTGEDIDDFYRRVRDENRAGLHDAEAQHGGLYMAGQIGGSIPTALIGGAAATGARMVGRAALEGGLYGVGMSEADNVGDVAADAALGGATGGLAAGALNRIGATVSPRVAPLVQRLMGQGVELTPTQIMKAGGPVARTIGNVVEGVGRRGAITSEVMKGAERRGAASLNRALADEALERDLTRRAAARQLEGKSPSNVLPTAAAEAAPTIAAGDRQAQALAQARAAGLNATPRDPTLAGRAGDLRNSLDFLSGVRGADAGVASADDLATALSRRTTQGLTHPDQYAGDLPTRVTDLVRNAGSVMSGAGKGSSSFDKLVNLLLGYGSSGATLAADAGLAAIYTKPGQAVVNRALTGRQGAVPQSIRTVTQRLSPFAGNAAAINTPTTGR